MASGVTSSRGAASEPRRRAYRTLDTDDKSSASSAVIEDRPNNWDFSDWRPSGAPFDPNKKRAKKGNTEREKENEASLSADSTPVHGKRHRTPATFPRTRVTSNTPASERASLEKLRQHLNFSDQDELSTDGERNNERLLPSRRDNPLNYTRQDTRTLSESTHTSNLPADRNAVGAAGVLTQGAEGGYHQGAAASGSQDGPDSNQIVGRLMQIRDYLKQAHAMMETFQKSGDASHSQIEKLEGLLGHLKEQEKGYMGLLQKILARRGDGGDGNSGDSKVDSIAESTSIDVDMQSDISEATTDCTFNAYTRPRCEDHLATFSEMEDNVPYSARTESSVSYSTMSAKGIDEDRDSGSHSLESDLGHVDKNDELNALRQQHELLKKMLQQQEQLKALQSRQSALLALQREAEQKMEQQGLNADEASDTGGEDTLEQTLTAAGLGTAGLIARGGEASESEQEEVSSMADNSDVVPEELRELRERLKYLKNMYEGSQSLSVNLSTDDQSQTNTESEMSVTVQDRKQLQNKLRELQEKKRRMDELLQELQSLRTERGRASNDLETASTTSSQIRINESIAATASANDTAGQAQEMIEMLDARQKLKKLTEVRERLNQLRDLVQYYQSGTAFIHGDGDEEKEETSLAAISDYEDPELMRNLKKLKERGTLSDQLVRYVQEEDTSQGTNPSQVEDTSTQGDTTSETESYFSSNVGGFEDDPEIQEKIRKLRAAKEKLRRLQELVAMVQQSPDAARVLPDDLAELAASIEDADTETVTSHATQTDDQPSFNYSEGEVPLTKQQREAFYEARMEEQKQELEELMGERKKLLAIQQQLQKLHEQFPDIRSPRQLAGREMKIKTRDVTFKDQEDDTEDEAPSNDELWDRMRTQRMLREELRQKKKELEAMMRKDRNNKTYSRNQDNQSDFGTSVHSADVTTMATWGGSSIDNLEDIFEDEGASGNGQEMDDDDDGYPSDGIVQVEEEEEAKDSDNETYTIEDEYQRRERQRIQRPIIDGTRPKQRYDPQDPRNNPWSPSRYTGIPSPRQQLRQGNYRSAEDIIRDNEGAVNEEYVRNLQRQLDNTTSICQSLLQDQQALMEALGQLPTTQSDSYRQNVYHNMFEQYQNQMQNQALLFSINQLHQTLAAQQCDIQTLQYNLSQVLGEIDDELDRGEGLYPQRPGSVGPWGSSRPTSAGPWLPSPGPYNPFVMSPSPLLGLSPMTRPSSAMFNPYQASYSYANPYGMSSLGRNVSSRSQQTDYLSATVGTNTSPVHDPSRVRAEQEARQNATRGQYSSHPTEPAPLPKSPVPPLHLEELLKRRANRGQVDGSARSEVSEVSSSAVIGRVYPTPSRATAAARLASRQHPDGYRPGLSAGISGTAFLDTASMSSAISSVPGGNGAVDGIKSTSEIESDNPSEFSLFEALRETIYSEVATLISQNENRPHFLIELFRELQMLNSDYLRQRALYSIQDLVTRFLTEDSVSESVNAPLPPWLTGRGITASEQTPSESFITSDEEEIKARLTALSKGQGQGSSVQSGSVKSDRFDYVENAESASSMSTPPSGPTWDNPFAQDLGDTVIHLDKAMQRMREYERRLADASGTDGASPANTRRQISKDTASEATSSSAQGGGSESSISDVPYPRIDTQQLDQQIKAIMTEIIPVLKEHMDDMCSAQLLAYIQRLVLSLTRQRNEEQEFVRFFHKQLGSLLQDSLAKFEGRKMRECAEDLLVDMSEVLFNELAFFKLMQDLDDTTTEVKARAKQWAQESQTSTENTEDQQGDLEEDTSERTETEDSDDDGEDVDTAVAVSPKEEEDLGKARDDEMADLMDIDDKDDLNNQSEIHVELAVSETKPFTRIGSDEDEEDEDEEENAEDPSETAVSRDAEKEKSGEETGEGDGTADGTGAPGPVASSPGSGGGDADGTTTGEKKEAAQVNGEVDGEDLTIDDLPKKMTGISEAEVDNKMNEENAEGSMSLRDAILSVLPDGDEQLAGDGQAIREPEETSV